MRRCSYGKFLVGFVVTCSGVILGGLPLTLRAGTAPSSYTAYTGTDTKTIPPAPALGPANSAIVDPTFGSSILRVTDTNTNGGESLISTDSGFSRAWNADSTAIKLTGPHGDGYWLEFNPSTFKVGDGSSQPKLHPLSFGATWEWSAVDPKIIYFLSGSKIETYNISSGVTTPVAGTPTGEPVAYMAAVVGLDNWVCAAAGTGSQNNYTKIFCVNPSNPSTSKFIDVYQKTINGVAQTSANWPTSATGAVIGIHDISGGTGPSWLEVTFHQQSWGANGGAVFDLSANTWSLVTNADPYWSGHVSMGNGRYENGSGSINGRDSRGTVVRDPDNLMNPSEYLFAMQPPDTLNNWCDGEHSSWLNSVTNPNAPILDSRYTMVAPCQFAWSGEIVAFAVDGSDTVWRFAHNHNGGTQCYYAESFAQISNDGNWALFSSYWDGTLGSDTSFGCTTRIDTFIVKLTGGTDTSSSAGTASTSSPSTTTSTTSSTTVPATSSTGAPTASNAAPTITTTRTEQSSSAVSYSAGWYAVSNGTFSGGSAAEAMNAGSTASFTFTGAAVRWIGYRDQWSGIATVYLDGQLQATVDTYASPALSQTVVWGASGLSSASHTLTITVTGTRDSTSGGNWVWIDALDVDTSSATTTSVDSATSASTTTTSTGGSTASTGNAAASGAVTLIQQNNSAIAYAPTGDWYNVNNQIFNGGSAVEAMNQGDTANLSFVGTGISWIGYQDQWSGIAEVYLDGNLVGRYDTYAATTVAKAVPYQVTGLASGSHQLEIYVTGQKDAQSGGAWIWVDGFNITP